MNTGLAVCRGWPFVENEVVLGGTLLYAFLEDVVFLPKFQDVLIYLRQV
jgi:hypothetical protein